MIFYGTGAAEGIPSPFCRCEICENARRVGGKEIRRRSMFRLSDSACIDLGADAFQLAIESGDFYDLRHVLITHTHEDHFAHMMMNVRNMGKEHAPEPLQLYFTDKAYDIVDFYRQQPPIIKGLTQKLEERRIISFHKLEFGQAYAIGGMTVTPYRGSHFGNMGEHCANYRLKLPDGRTLFYGLDTGWYLDETFDTLKGAALELFISECTFGLRERERHPESHLDAASNVLLLKKLLLLGAITPQTDIYLTHINQSSTHAQLVAYFERISRELGLKITVAWDGMVI